MPETHQQYVSRILSNVQGEPLDVLATTGSRLSEMVKDISLDKLRARPSPTHWSMAEILAHLADTEIAVGFRLRKIASEPGCAIAAFDQDAWASALGYASRDPAQSVRDFINIRRTNLNLLRGLTADQWEHFGVHEERGKETITHIVRLVAGHDINHLRQVETIRSK